MALAALDGDSAVILKTELQSKPYVDMTIKVMKDYGVDIRETDFGYLVKGGQKFKVQDYVVEAIGRRQHFSLSAVQLTARLPLKGLI